MLHREAVFVPLTPEKVWAGHKISCAVCDLSIKYPYTYRLTEVSPTGGCLASGSRVRRGHTPATLCILSCPRQKLLSLLEGVPLRDDWKEDAAGRQRTTPATFIYFST